MKQRNLFGKPKQEPPKSKSPSKNFMNPPARNNGETNDRFTQPFLEKMKLKNPDDIKIYEEIQRHRLQLLIWSKMYYDMDTSIVEDRVFDKVGKELVILQRDYPEISKMVAYYEEFKDWDASTGFHLPLKDPWVCWKANQLLKKKGNENGIGKK